MVEIRGIEPGSIADQAGLRSGDRIISINGQPVRDYIDFQYETADSFFSLEIKKKDGDSRQLEIYRPPGKGLGIILEGIIYDSLKLCRNNCLFCFVNQQPPGLRETLLLKDDDYRFSFLQGSFITLTNITPEEIRRIVEFKLSPLNISVHTTNPALRERMMKNPRAGLIMEQLKSLAGGGIGFNAQIVLCPGINDRAELDRTITDLSTLSPALISIGIVPVGLTGYRENLEPLVGYDSQGARGVLEQIKGWQNKLAGGSGENFLYCADEFYFLAGEDLPRYEEYHDFPQLENGIGLTRLLWRELEELEDSLPPGIGSYGEESPETVRQIGFLTAEAGAGALIPVIRRFAKIAGLKPALIVVPNRFFGGSVTVTGLLTGEDMIRELLLWKERGALPAEVIIPGITINEKGKFLDGLSSEDIENRFAECAFYICDNLEEVLEVITDDQASGCDSRQTKCREIDPF